MQEGDKQLVKLMIDSDAAAMLLKLAGGPRKQGEYISTIIRAIASEAGLMDAGAATAVPIELTEVEKADMATLRQGVQQVLQEMRDLRVAFAVRTAALTEELERVKTQLQQQR